MVGESQLGNLSYACSDFRIVEWQGCLSCMGFCEATGRHNGSLVLVSNALAHYHS